MIANTNTTANFSSLTWVAMAQAGWNFAVVARSGKTAIVNFTAPSGVVETREVQVSRLGHRAFAQMERVAPLRRVIQRKMCS